MSFNPISKRSLVVLCFAGFTVACANLSTQNTKSSYQGLGQDSVNSETLAKYAPGTLPADLSRKIQNYLDIRAPGLGMLHPDGKRLFFTWRVTGSNQIWRIDGPKSFAVQMTGGEDATTLSGITRDGKFLIVTRDRNGEENPGLYLQPVDGGPIETIQQIPKVQTYFEGQSRDGRWLYFRANDINADSYTIYRYSLAEKKKEILLNEKGYWSISDKLNDEFFIMTKVLSNIRTEVYLFNLKTKTLKSLFGLVEPGEFNVLMTNKADEYFVQTPKFGEFRQLYHWKKDKWTPLTANIKADVTSIAISENREKLVYAINDGGYSKVKVLAVSNLKEISLPIPKGIDHSYVAWISPDGKKMTLGLETSRAPRNSYIYDFNTQKLTQWLLPSSPEVETKKFAVATLEYYPAQDGTKIPMFVRRPPQCPVGAESKCPAIVNFHGGPEAQSTPGFHVYAQIFVDAGFIFIEPNVRGSDGYGQTWLNADNAANRLKVIGDIRDMSTFLRESWKTKKVGVMGGSYGGYSTFYAMTKFAGHYDAGVENVGMSNLMTFLMNTAPYRRQLRIAEYGDPEKDRDALIELSPITHIDKIQAPLMMIQGVNDPRVPVGEAIQFAQAMEKKNIPHELLLFADEGHGASKRNNQVIQIGKIVQFFEKHLK